MNSVYKLLIQLIGKDAGATRELKKTKRATDGLTTSVNKMGSAMKSLAGLGMVYMGRMAVSAAWDLAQLGAESLRMEASFNKLATRIDTTGEALLDSLSAAARGTVTDMDLMRTTAGLLASGIQTSTQDITDAMEIAQLKAQQFGITTTEAYERMVTGARKFSVEMLDEIGITIKAENAYKRRAEALGTVASALTDAQRAEALWLAILEDGRGELAEYGGATDDLLTDMQRTQVAVEEMKIAFAEELAPAIIDVTNAITDLIPALSGLATGPAAQVVVGIAADFTEMANSVRLWTAVFEGTISPIQAFTAEIEAGKIKADEGVEAMSSYIDSILGVSRVTEGATDAHEEWRLSLHKLPGTLASANTALGIHASNIAEVYSIYTRMRGLPQRVLDLDPLAAKSWEILQDERQSAEDKWIRDSLRRLHGFERANEETARSVGKTWQDTYDEIRGAVEAALQPTAVTALDMQLSELGQYVDKWDENARRLDAVAEAGFAAFDAHPDWVEILKIPDNVLALGEEGLKSWAAQTADSVRALTRPDLLNIDAAVAAVEQYFADMAARELSIDLVTQAMIDKGVISGPDAKKMVAQALGLDQTIVGETAGGEIFDAMVGKFQEKSATTEFAAYLKEDADQNKIKLIGAGKSMWYHTEQGILEAMRAGQYVDVWIALLLPGLIAALGTSTTWTGGGEP